MKTKNEFISLASHQLRTPLSEIRWQVELIQDVFAGRKDPKERHFLARIAAADLRMINLVDNLLNTSRLESNTFTLHPEVVAVKDLIDVVIKEQEPQISFKKLEVKVNIEKHLKTMQSDPVLLYIILQNMITNAIKYNKDGGILEVQVGYHPKSKEKVCFMISDTGWGIPAKERDRIFTKLFRATNVVTKPIDGSGLGLYLVKSIVDFLHGTIEFSSEEDRGTSFTITLPTLPTN